jgi:hypothetical protein
MLKWSKRGKVEKDQEVDGEAISYHTKLQQDVVQIFYADFHADSKGKKTYEDYCVSLTNEINFSKIIL